MEFIKNKIIWLSLVLFSPVTLFAQDNNTDGAIWKNWCSGANCGYDDFRHLEKDIDLCNLRKDRRFQRYFLRIKSRKVSQDKE